MKAITYAKRIKARQATSVHEVEKLSHAMHREGLLDAQHELSFMPLYGKFRYINADYFNTGVLTYEDIVNIDEIISFIENEVDISC